MTRRGSAPLLLLAAAFAAACDVGPAAAPRVAATLDIGAVLGGADTLHARAVDVRRFEFPRDHGAHPEFRTEWWYFTGNLDTPDGRAFGYQLTFFRSALVDSAAWLARNHEGGEWRARHAWMAHFAVTDIRANRFHSAERFARGAAGLAGAQAQPFRVWLHDWHATGTATPGEFGARLVASDAGVAIDLVVEQGKPVVLQGDRGLSRKGPAPGNASYYYSFTRMPTRGTIRIGAATYDVTGTSWLDREWSTSVLSDDIAGWDWMALQFDDGTELMLYHLRRHDGSPDEFSAGTYVRADGTAVSLELADFVMVPQRHWRSPLDGTAYPVAWRVDIPSLQLALEVEAAIDAQEMNHAVRYWEGTVRVRGVRAAAAVAGRGYLEMTGY